MRIQKSYTLSSATCDQVEAIARITGMDASRVVEGCVMATWAAMMSQGFRKFPSTVEALSVTGAAGASFYIQGERAGECEES